MAASCRFAFAVHILAVLAHQPEGGMTSERLARSVNTNPVVIRRLLSTLRAAGLICCAKGAGGGATLCRPPAEVTLDMIYRAAEPGASFSAHPHKPNERCHVGRKIELVLSHIFSSAQQALEVALAQRTLADVLEEMEDVPAAGSPEPVKAA